MDETYFSLLPSEAHRLVEEIEAATGREVHVEPISNIETDRYPHMKQFSRIQRSFLPPYEIIYFPEGELSPRMLVHELLHLHRYMVQEIPCICSYDYSEDIIKNMIDLFENDLEHFHIIPIECDLVPNSASRWGSLYHNLSKSLQENKESARFNLFRHYLVSTVIHDHPHLTRDIEAALIGWDLLVEARAFVGRLRECSSKIDQILIGLNLLGIPLNAGTVVSYDKKNREYLQQDILSE